MPVTAQTLAGHARWIERTQSDSATKRRFWARVAKHPGDGCWIWMAGTNGRYGKFRMPGREAYAHRVAYEWTHGEIPEGLTLDHLCNQPLCCRPSHLEPVTLQVNIQRAAARRTHCPHGHPLSGDNLYIRPNTGHRACRICMKGYRPHAPTCIGYAADGSPCGRHTTHESGYCWSHRAGVDTLDTPRPPMNSGIGGNLDTRLDTSWTPSAPRAHGCDGWTA
jgi:hypothetical protein